MGIWSSSAADDIVFAQEDGEMAWYRNHYHCGDCGADWEDEWSCCCDDECPRCGSGDWSAVESEDLTEVIEETELGFVVVRSPSTADDKPRYLPVARFETHELAQRFVLDGEPT
jgi:hypothetical protein